MVGSLGVIVISVWREYDPTEPLRARFTAVGDPADDLPSTTWVTSGLNDICAELALWLQGLGR